MNKHLIFILVFIIVIPIGAINWVGYTLDKCHSDSAQCSYNEYFMEKVTEGEQSRYVYLIKIITFYFIFVGGYFLVTHLRWIGSTKQKVSLINQVSHELKTPLTNIRLYLDLLKSSLVNDEGSLNKIDILEKESKRLENLVHNILLFSYGERLEISPRNEDIDKLITRSVENFRPLFDQNGIEIQLDCEAGEAIVDSSVLEQVLINLIGNVGKYALDGKFINIKARNINDQVSIRIQDDGVGIPETMKETIFKPFERGDDSLIEGVSGIGIGLTLCVNLMEAHGGTLKLIKTDNGTCFEVTF